MRILCGGDTEKALVDHNHAIRLEPRNPKYYLSRAAVWASMNLGDSSERADADFARADQGERSCFHH